ncbi:MAG: VWA domain-containing protein [Candidatus Obscuribacterales bacterium]|jgi:hypothetical protein|nr:VWA domain-containing protein [Candidatus Obscuribacterales bacterium]
MFGQCVGNHLRSKKGLAVALPMIIIALTIILAIGLFAFEIARMAISRDQLQAATESAALAGAAAMAGSSNTDIAVSQQEAKEAAKRVFRQNFIFNSPLLFSTESTSPPVIAGFSTFSFQFLDPNNNNAPVPEGDPRGKAFEVRSIYALPSLAGSALGFGNTFSKLEAKSSGGVGELDVVMCFDCSNSMRFRTFTTSVSRTFNVSTGQINYNVLAQRELSPTGGMRPQDIGNLSAQLRGATDNSMPGNTPPSSASQNPNGLTDIVVNLDERLAFAGFTEGDFTFPNIAALVEASRGNLENESVFRSSGAALALEGVVTPKSGYQAKYFELARKHTHPWAEAEKAATDFFTLMNNNTRAHFGLVAFNTIVGNNAAFTFTQPNVANNYPVGGQGVFPLPSIPLNATEGETNFQATKDAIATLVPFGNTNMGGSLDRAQQFFTSSTSRPNAKKAIIMFTDGIPTAGVPSPEQACFSAANACRQKGIAVFTVGLNLAPQERQEQAQVLNQITGIAGNGGRFFQVNDASKLNGAFSSIARSLTQIVQ